MSEYLTMPMHLRVDVLFGVFLRHKSIVFELLEGCAMIYNFALHTRKKVYELRT